MTDVQFQELKEWWVPTTREVECRVCRIARQDIPALVAEVERLRAEVAAYREAFDGLPVFKGATPPDTRIPPQGGSSTAPPKPALTTAVSGCHPSHVTRSSDASTYDEVCIHCGATDIVPGGWGELALPCPKAPKPASPRRQPSPKGARLNCQDCCGFGTFDSGRQCERCDGEGVLESEDCAACGGAGGADKYLPDDPGNKLGHGPCWYKCDKCRGTGLQPKE